MAGQSLEHSFKALGLGLGATETEVKVRYCALAQIYHPDKHNPARTGMTQAAAANYFKLINNAQAYLCEVLWHPPPLIQPEKPTEKPTQNNIIQKYPPLPQLYHPLFPLQLSQYKVFLNGFAAIDFHWRYKNTGDQQGLCKPNEPSSRQKSSGT